MSNRIKKCPIPTGDSYDKYNCLESECMWWSVNQNDCVIHAFLERQLQEK